MAEDDNTTAAEPPVRRRRRRRDLAPEGDEKPVSTSVLVERRIRANKARFLEELRTTMGVFTIAAEKTGITTRTVERWRKIDVEFDEAVREIDRRQFDYVENKLLQLIRDGDRKSIHFYLRCKGRRYGYNPGLRIEGDMQVEHHHEHSGSVTIDDQRERMPESALALALQDVVHRIQKREAEGAGKGKGARAALELEAEVIGPGGD